MNAHVATHFGDDSTAPPVQLSDGVKNRDDNEASLKLVSLMMQAEDEFAALPQFSSPNKPFVGTSHNDDNSFIAESDDAVSSSDQLHDLLTSLHPNNRNPQHSAISRVYFVDTPCHHYASVSGVDRGWGCGYRNIQTLLSALMRMPELKRRLFDGTGRVPSIHNIQLAIEKAWSEGFDRDGAAQLKGVLGTTKWIGTTECYTLLTYFGIDCSIVDFTHVSTNPEVMLEFLERLFSRSDSRMFPIYFQHDGHSRTLIGLERYHSGEIKLLLLDPSVKDGEGYESRLLRDGLRSMPNLRRTVNSLRRKDEFQLLTVSNRLLSPEERVARKIVSGTRIDCAIRSSARSSVWDAFRKTEHVKPTT
jgi:hypothetical protein